MKKSAIVLTVLVGLGLAFLAGSWVSRPPSTGGQVRASRRRSPIPVRCTRPTDRTIPATAPLRHAPGAGGPAAADGDATLAETPGVVRIDADKQQLIGVRIDEVLPASAAHLALRVPGRVAVDEQRLYRVIAAVDGWIRKLGPNPAGARSSGRTRSWRPTTPRT